MSSKLQVKKGQREIKMTDEDKTRLAKAHCSVRVNYCEKSLSKVILVDPRETIETVCNIAKEEISQHVARGYTQLAVDIDDECTDIFPTPPSNIKMWGQLSKDASITMWPKDPSSNDQPLHSAFIRQPPPTDHENEATRMSEKFRDELVTLNKDLKNRLDVLKKNFDDQFTFLKKNFDNQFDVLIKDYEDRLTVLSS